MLCLNHQLRPLFIIDKLFSCIQNYLSCFWYSVSLPNVFQALANLHQVRVWFKVLHTSLDPLQAYDDIIIPKPLALHYFSFALVWISSSSTWNSFNSPHHLLSRHLSCLHRCFACLSNTSQDLPGVSYALLGLGWTLDDVINLYRLILNVFHRTLTFSSINWHHQRSSDT